VLTAMLAKRQREWSRPRIIAAVGLAAIPFVMWTWINVSETSSVTRFERMLELDPDRALNAYESLGRYHSERREWVQTVRILGTALATRDHHRLYTQRGIAFSGIGQYDSALAAFRRAVALDSLYADGQFGCGQMLWLLHRTDEGLPYLKRAVAMDTTRVQYRFQLALALRDAGYPDSALPHLEYATRMVSNQPVYADIYAENLFETGHADSAVTVLRNMMQRFPSLASPYAKLAWMFYERNDVANANSALIGYEKRTRPQDRSARTIGLRRTLDSIRAATDAPSE
jgi:tetratricopeptide (TPR) repeat protein